MGHSADDPTTDAHRGRFDSHGRSPSGILIPTVPGNLIGGNVAPVDSRSCHAVGSRRGEEAATTTRRQLASLSSCLDPHQCGDRPAVGQVKPAAGRGPLIGPRGTRRTRPVRTLVWVLSTALVGGGASRSGRSWDGHGRRRPRRVPGGPRSRTWARDDIVLAGDWWSRGPQTVDEVPADRSALGSSYDHVRSPQRRRRGKYRLVHRVSRGWTLRWPQGRPTLL